MEVIQRLVHKAGFSREVAEVFATAVGRLKVTPLGKIFNMPPLVSWKEYLSILVHYIVES